MHRVTRPSYRRAFALVAALSLLLVGQQANAAFQDNFERPDPLTGWQTLCGTWADTVGHGSTHGLVTRDSLENVLLHSSFSRSYGRYEFDLLLPSVSDSGVNGGIQVQRLGNSYCWAFEGPAGGASGGDRIMRVLPAAPQPFITLGCTTTHLSAGSWHSIQLDRFPNGVFRLYTDGNLKVEAFDTLFTANGGLALSAYGRGVRFDNVSYDSTALPADPPIPGPPSCGAYSPRVICGAGGQPQPPPAPSFCSASDDQISGVAFTWEDVSGESGYYVYRNGLLVSVTDPDVTSFTDAPRVGTYEYCVQAFNFWGSSLACCDFGTGLPVPQTLPPCGSFVTVEPTERQNLSRNSTFSTSAQGASLTTIPMVREPVPLESSSERGIPGARGFSTRDAQRGTQAGPYSVLYPGACFQRYQGTWTLHSSLEADSLNTYAAGTTGPYSTDDQSLSEILWHVRDDAGCFSGTGCPPALAGTRSIWCGKFEACWTIVRGYPNSTYQVLYIDTGDHAGNYDLNFLYNFSAQLHHDYVYLIGGGDGAVDPLGNSRSALDAVISTGVFGGAELLARWTGSITPSTAGAVGGNTTADFIDVEGSDNGVPIGVSASFTVSPQHRALYLVFKSDAASSSEDGQWPFGNGQLIDNVSTSDNGNIYTEQIASGGTDSYSGAVLVGTPGSPIVSARIPQGIGTLWQLVPGSNLPTPDFCTPKNSAADLIFEGGNPANGHTVPNQFNSIRTCTFPVPGGVGAIVARWREYLDLPPGSGYVQFAEYRMFKAGNWYDWTKTRPSGDVVAGSVQAWIEDGDVLAPAAHADSIQLRFTIQCVPFLAADHLNCGDVVYGVLYDDLRLEYWLGEPPPQFGVYPGSIAQTTFVDGTMLGLNCTTAPCWPGIRGTDLAVGGIDDNFNSPVGDSIVISIQSGLRKSGMGINWHRGFSKFTNGGQTITHTNGAFNPAYDAPRVIYRIFDPTNRSWSPFDSSELDADDVVQGYGHDTILVNSAFRMDWPPRDKLGSSLPSGFTVNGKSLYSELAFLPRGTRIQYYWKVVDINGSRLYHFASEYATPEVADLPFLPGGGVRAPDIVEFDVLPGVYPVGTSSSLLAGSTRTPLLNLDGAYAAWSSGTDPVTQALRGLGVRADRYRLLQEGLGGNIGGHEFPGDRVNALTNYFPNMGEYSIRDSLASWYRIIIQSSDSKTFPVVDESDAALIKSWWEEPTGVDGGDRCIFASGDDAFNSIFNSSGLPNAEQSDMAQEVFGVIGAAGAWSGTVTNQTPTLNDRFADPAAGPALGAVGSFIYTLSGKCPYPKRFDALARIGSAEVQSTPFYPGAVQVAGLSYMTEWDAVTDHDRNKSRCYGYSIQRVGSLERRMRVLYKFLASCRGPRSASDTASCWPCPTDANMSGNWASLSGFQTGTYGPLYPIQDHTTVTTVNDPGSGAAPPLANALLQNRPNPFNPATLITFTTAHPGRVTIRVFAIGGTLVKTLVDGVRPAGVHSVRWDGHLDSGKNAASGIYFYNITYPDGSTSSKKMTMLR